MGSPPVNARMAGPTQLAFIVPPDLPRFPVTLANLLDWSRYEQAGTALDNPGQPPPLQRPDLDRQTAIEIPYRLLLSVDNASGWSHTTTAPTDLSELWNTRLAFRKPLGAGRFVIDERPSSGPRQGRVYYTPDLDAPEDPVSTSLTSKQRPQIAHLSCDPSPAAHAFDVRELMLTALGGTLHLDTGWNPPLGFDVTLWQHTASFGRDQYVRVGQRGFVAPYGHRATKITVSERRFIAQPDGAQAVAYLVQFSYIIITQPVRSYAGLDLPLTAIEFVTRVTPALSAPQPFPNTNASWIRSLGNEPLLFDLTATDLRDRTIGFRAPAIFIEDDPLFENSVTEAVNHFQSDSTINTPVDFRRQKIAFAPSDDDEATTFETAAVSLGITDLRPGGSGTWRDSQTGEPLFRPGMEGASIRHAAATALAGAPDTISVKYFPDYVKQASVHAAAAVDGVDVFLLIDSPPVGKLSADKSGVASPAYSLTSISKQFGAVGGKPENILAQNIVPSDFLNDSARFLGDIRLSQILNSAGISQIPNLNTVVNKAPDGTPTSTVTTFEWHPPLESLSLAALSLTFTNSTLDLKVKITAQLATPPVPPVSELHGKVGSFDLSFAGLIALHFNSMTFDSVTGQKPNIDVTLKKNPVPVEFLGELAFVNALRDLIPSGGFSPASAVPSAALVAAAAPVPANGPFLEVTPSQIIAGFALAVPSVGIGVFSLENIRLSAALTLPLEDKPVGFAFNFGERDHKFLLTVDLLAGGGFLAIELSSQGVQRLEFAVEFGANVALNLFVASGSAHVLAGVHLAFTQSEGKSFIAYLRAGGELTVLGLVSISVDFYLALGYRTGPPDDLYGIASLTVEVSVAFISKSVTLTMERSFPGSGGGAGQLEARHGRDGGRAGSAGSVGHPERGRLEQVRGRFCRLREIDVAVTKLVWIALPNGLADNGQTLRISAYLAPALVAAQNSTVAQFPLFSSWPDTAAGIRFQISFDGGVTLSSPVSAIYDSNNALDVGLWKSIFGGNVAVGAHEPLSTDNLQSYDAGSVYDTLHGIYIPDPSELPPSESVKLARFAERLRPSAAGPATREQLAYTRFLTLPRTPTGFRSEAAGRRNPQRRRARFPRRGFRAQPLSGGDARAGLRVRSSDSDPGRPAVERHSACAARLAVPSCGVADRVPGHGLQYR